MISHPHPVPGARKRRRRDVEKASIPGKIEENVGS